MLKLVQLQQEIANEGGGTRARSKGEDLRSSVEGLRGFESHPPHQNGKIAGRALAKHITSNVHSSKREGLVYVRDHKMNEHQTRFRKLLHLTTGKTTQIGHSWEVVVG
jgi:hypothetical protein